MSFQLSDIRSDVGNILASAIDASTWTTTLIDETVRETLFEYAEKAIPYETTTTTNANSQIDVSALSPSCYKLIAVSWPWTGYKEFFNTYLREFHHIDSQIVAINGIVAGASITVGIRYLRLFTINGLDSAVSTTVPDAHRRIITIGAAAHALRFRIRQITENPAIPRGAIDQYEQLAARWEDEFDQRMASMHHAPNPSWSRIGL